MTGSPDPASAEARLDALLGTLPPPQMPAGLAARIVRDVTRLPQLSADVEDAPAIQPSPEPVAAKVVAITSAPSRKRWLAWAGGGLGTALAAGLATLLLMPEAVRQDSAPIAVPTRVPETKPAMAESQPAPVVSPAQPEKTNAAPRLARIVPTPTAPDAPAPLHPMPHGLPVALPRLETAEATPPPAAEVAPQMADAPDDTALPDTGLASGNMVTPSRNGGQAPTPQQGWGYSGSTGYPAGSGTAQPDDDTGIRPERGRGGRRF